MTARLASCLVGLAVAAAGCAGSHDKPASNEPQSAGSAAANTTSSMVAQPSSSTKAPDAVATAKAYQDTAAPSLPPRALPAAVTLPELMERFGPRGLASRAKFKDVRVTTSGDPAHRFVLLEPQGVTVSAHVVLFFHGWDGINPKFYGAWLDYLTRQGQVVVFIGYQAKPNDAPSTITDVAHHALTEALKELRAPGHAPVDLTSVGAIGYSMGASVALNLALPLRFPDLPRISGLFLANPADGFDVPSGKTGGSILLGVEQLPADTRVVIAIAESDAISKRGRPLYKRLCYLPAAQRNLIVLHSDSRATPALKADHVAPSAYSRAFDYDPTARASLVLPPRSDPWTSSGIDALDLYGYWKLADALLDATFARVDAAAAFGSGPAVRFAGVLPDGRPTNQATVEQGICEQ